jgi:hypothetical protein
VVMCVPVFGRTVGLQGDGFSITLSSHCRQHPEQPSCSPAGSRALTTVGKGSQPSPPVLPRLPVMSALAGRLFMAMGPADPSPSSTRLLVTMLSSLAMASVVPELPCTINTVSKATQPFIRSKVAYPGPLSTDHHSIKPSYIESTLVWQWF